MKNYDVIVIGSGCGTIVSDAAMAHGKKVALVDKGPLGGTCLNLGCIPSKMLIYAADRVMDIQESGRLGVEGEVRRVNFLQIMERMRKSVRESQAGTRRALAEFSEALDFYEGEGRFIGDMTLEVKGESIRGERIVIACGSRPFMPPVNGLGDGGCWTSEDVLLLERPPESLIIIGGGYIAAEYGHFFAAMGTRVSMWEMADRITPSEDPDVSELLARALSRRMEVHTGVLVEELRGAPDGRRVMVGRNRDGSRAEATAENILVAAGRISNADLLRPDNTGVEMDSRGFIKVDDYLETTRKNIYAVGDVNGLQMFTHAANRQAELVADAIMHDARSKIDLSATPHAIYSRPQVASVGMTAAQAGKDRPVLIGRAPYSSVAKGEAMMEYEGLAKAVVDRESGHLLGFHIAGPLAPELIQEVTNCLALGGDPGTMAAGMHIHPALNELIMMTLSRLEEA